MDAEPYRYQPVQQPYRRVRLLCLWLLVIVAAGLLWLWQMPEIQVLSVQSGSMAPLINKGDAVVVEPVGANPVQVNDVISYHSPQDPKVVITHRVQSVDRQTGLVTTKGDANTTADPPFAASLVVGRVQQRVIGAGRVIDLLHSTFGLVAAIYIPALVIVTMEFRTLTAYFRPTYRHIRARQVKNISS